MGGFDYAPTHAESKPEPGAAILYASQTGTAEEAAWDVFREGRRLGFCLQDPQMLDEVSLEGFCKLRTVIFFISTTGQGDPPTNMRRLWQQLVSTSLPQTLLAGLRFAVFGLGDSHYREFNYAARKLHARLKHLGAEPFFRLGLGDDQHDFGLEQEMDPWTEGMWAALAELLPATPMSDASGAGGSLADSELRYEVTELGEIGDTTSCPDIAAVEGSFAADVVANYSLCTEQHVSTHQDVINVRLRMPSGLSFTAGDVCVVWPRTDPGLVRQFVVDTLGRSLQEYISICPLRSGGSSFPDRPLTLEEVFSCYIDVAAVPSRHFFHVLSLHTEDELHKQKLAEFASKTLEAKDALYEYCKREQRSAVEVMWDFWTARPPLRELLSCLPLLRPRRYSIASCPGWNKPWWCADVAAEFWCEYQRKSFWKMPTQKLNSSTVCKSVTERFRQHSRDDRFVDFDLCVGVVNFITRTNRSCKGLCSNFLKESCLGQKISCSLEAGSLKLPALHVPMILVCPGTGLSPCRSLLQQRHMQLLSSPASAKSRFGSGMKDLVFLGFRHQDGDFLYGDQWVAFAEWLAVHVAFSRDHEDKKVYVQDLIEENGAHVCRLLKAGAVIFVCGRSHPMPSQVFDSFCDVLQMHEGMTEDAASAKLRMMQRSQRYICDTWG